MAFRWLAVSLIAVVLAPAALHAQRRGQSCEVKPGQTSKVNIVNNGTPQQITFISGMTEFACTGDVTIRSDSGVSVAATDTRYFIGHVFYSDPDKTLTASRVTQFGREGHVNAQENVIFTDKKNGSVVHGQNLDYYEKSATMPEAKASIYGTPRPHAVMYQKGAAPGTPAADTTAIIIDSDQMDLRGEHFFHATNNVKLTRGDVKGSGGEAEYDRESNVLKLMGQARIDGKTFSLSGGTITGTLKDNAFKDVTAEFKGSLVADELRVEAPVIKIAFLDGKVGSMVALNATRSKREALEGKSPARAFARDFELTADSIDALTPNQQIERVVAVGNAYGVRTNDSIKVKLPDIASKDWLRGDTIRAYFIPATPHRDKAARTAARNAAGANTRGRPGTKASAPAQPAVASRAKAAPAAVDTTQRELERIIATAGANDAQSTYRIANDKDPNGEPGINYLVARQITVQFREGDVSSVQATGKIRGVHLEPKAKPVTPAAGQKTTPGATPAQPRPTTPATPAGPAAGQRGPSKR